MTPPPAGGQDSCQQLSDESFPAAVAVFDRHPASDLVEHELGCQRGHEDVGQVARVGGLELTEQVADVSSVRGVDG